MLLIRVRLSVTALGLLPWSNMILSKMKLSLMKMANIFRSNQVTLGYCSVKLMIVSVLMAIRTRLHRMRKSFEMFLSQEMHGLIPAI